MPKVGDGVAFESNDRAWQVRRFTTHDEPAVAGIAVGLVRLLVAKSSGDVLESVDDPRSADGSFSFPLGIDRLGGECSDGHETTDVSEVCGSQIDSPPTLPIKSVC